MVRVISSKSNGASAPSTPGASPVEHGEKPRLGLVTAGGEDEQGRAVALHDVPASEIKTGKTDWLWPGRMIRGTICILQGSKGAGKSSCARAITAHVTGGVRLPGTTKRKRFPGNVLYYAGEESLKTRVKPGLLAAGADLKRVFCADAFDDGRGRLRLPSDCERLEHRIKDRQAQLVVIDPIFCFGDGVCKLEAGTEEARQFTGPLAAVADRTGATILLTRNLTKGRGRSALDAGRGSGEITNAARSVLHVAPVPNQELFGLAVAACNEAEQAPLLLYRIVDRNGVGVIEFTGESRLTADELAAGEDGELDRTLLSEAEKTIRQVLLNGEVESKIVKQKLEETSCSPRTAQAAAKKLGVLYRREGSRESTKVYWRLPKAGGGS